MSGRCNRFESDQLLALERGEPIDPHVATCPDCQAMLETYASIKRDLGELGQDLQPPADAEARICAAIARGESGAKRARLVWLVAPGLVVAALLLWFVLAHRPGASGDDHSRPIELALAVEPGSGPVQRGDAAKPGDLLVAAAQTGDYAFVELRVYRNDEQRVVQCTASPPCERRGELIRLRWTIPSPGKYQVLLLLSRRPLALPQGSPNDVAEAALRGDVVVRFAELEAY